MKLAVPHAELGDLLQAAREAVYQHGLRYTQGQLADDVDLSRESITRYETGTHRPSQEKLQQILDCFFERGLPYERAQAIFQKAHPGRVFTPTKQPPDGTVSRRIAGTATDGFDSISVDLFTEVDQTNYFEEVKAAQELWTSGLNLKRLLDEHEDVFEDILARH